MWKITLCIVTFFMFFSIANITKVSSASIESILDLNFWFEDRQLNLDEINYYSYNSSYKNQMLNNFTRADKLLRQELTRLYRNWEINYNQMNWVISRYNKFIYHINRYFYYEYLKENYNYSELSIASNRNFKFARTYFNQTKNIINESRR